jgi:outer membrane lipoprotein-sorting protein
MRIFSIVLIGGLAAGYLAQSGSGQLAGHVKALQEAGSLRATLTVQPIGGAPSTVRIAFSKPNLLRLETADGWTLSDGKTLYRYVKKDQAWTETPCSEEEIAKLLGHPGVWAWRAFFVKDAFPALVSAKPGANRILKGVPTQELALAFEKSSATLYVDPKLMIARGFARKTDESDLIVTAAEIELGPGPLPAESFAFQAPAGAQKQEAPKVVAPSFSAIQALMNRNCMPCHSAQMRSGGYDLSNHAGILQGVVAGNPKASKLVVVVSPPNPTMPQFRPPLSAKDVETISKWVEAGAPKE